MSGSLEMVGIIGIPWAKSGPLECLALSLGTRPISELMLQ